MTTVRVVHVAADNIVFLLGRLLDEDEATSLFSSPYSFLNAADVVPTKDRIITISIKHLDHTVFSKSLR